MNSMTIINYARKDTGIRGWYMNNTLGGKLLLKHALQSKYGKQVKAVKNQFYRHERKKGDCTETRYLDKYYQPKASVLRKYDNNGSRLSLVSYCDDPKDIHSRTVLRKVDYQRLGRRESLFTRMKYNSETGNWDVIYKDQTIFTKNDDNTISVTKTVNDYAKQTIETVKKVFNLK